jgi:hypothetical protein
MGLKSDIKDAFLQSMGNPRDEGNTDQLAVDLSDAIITFLTKQTFTITEMKAVLEVEELKTTAPSVADILPSVSTTGIGNTGAPVIGQVTNGKGGVLIPKLGYRKNGGQGGALLSKGYSYIGRGAPQGETNEDLTSVKLLNENIVSE